MSSHSGDFDVKIAHNVEEIGQEAWDRLAAGRPFASYHWYRFGEAVRAGDLPVYIVLFRQGEPAARATFWLTRQEPLPISSAAIRFLAKAIMRRWPLFVCQSPLSSLSGLVLPEEPALRTAALRLIAQVALEQARSAHAIPVFDYLERDTALGPAWPEHFTPFEFSDPGTSLDITWPNFDSFVDQLSYKRRKNYRRNCRAADGLGVEVKYYPKVTALEEAMVLVRNVEQRHHEPPNPWARRAMENAPLIDSVWLAAEADGRLVGCELLLGDNDAWLVTALGLDYSLQYVYFRLGYADIRYAIEHGFRRLRWGSGAYEFKERMGFQAEDNAYGIFAPTSHMWRWIARWAAGSGPGRALDGEDKAREDGPG